MELVQIRVTTKETISPDLFQWELAKILEEVAKKIAANGGSVSAEEEKTSYLFTSGQQVSIWNIPNGLMPEEDGEVEIFFSHMVGDGSQIQKIKSTKEMVGKLIQLMKLLTTKGRGMEIVFGDQRFDCSLPCRTGWIMVTGMNYPTT